MDSFKITNFGPINKVDVQLGDLTILLGPQASGKTLFLQMLKLLVDKDHIVAEDTVADILQAVPVKKGDVFFIPAGTVHALAKGLNVIEIQQTSDITYRIFDWNRVDSEGKSRELHTALAVDAIDFESGVNECRRTYSAIQNEEVNIVDCEFFKTDILVVDGVAELDYCKRDSFTIYMCIEGDAEVVLDGEESETLRTGEVMLIPAIANEVVIKGKAQILASHL